MDTNIPVMVVEISQGSDGVISLVGRCPFCKRLHSHGGGRDMSNILFGSRVSHCLKDPREYELVPRVQI